MEPSGNYVSEWFGFRTFPRVVQNAASVEHQAAQTCPFLSAALGNIRECVKLPASKGVCTISCSSNGPRQEWLVCPYRALDNDLLRQVTSRLFGLAEQDSPMIVPAPKLATTATRAEFEAALRQGRRCFVYLQNKLGGEISLPATERSPEFAFDITLVEICRGPAPTVGKFGIFETQTMDFHGTYRHAVKNLQDALRLHRREFGRMVGNNPQWLSEEIEGPNIANVFKRTFYQMMVKFQVGMNEASAGCAIAIPASVWDSWQRHLARPELSAQADGSFKMLPPTRSTQSFAGPLSWIYVFDLDVSGRRAPTDVTVKKVIATNAKTMSYYALEAAPSAVFTGPRGSTRVVESIRRRISEWWPALSGSD